MALQKIRLTWDQSTNEPHDRVVWSWGFDGPVLDNVDLANLWDPGGAAPAIGLKNTFTTNAAGETGAMTSVIATGLSSRILEVFPAEGGEATAVFNVLGDVVGGGGVSLPSEVQLVLSRYIATPRGESPKGRLYVGPMGGSGTRPVATHITRTLKWAGMVRDEFVGMGGDECVLHGAGSPGATCTPIIDYAVDNAWDTQRRRGWDPTARTFLSDL